ncbi:RNA polymerase sigma factor [Nocardia takedensis]|uniref:RNA polymerase sigma factor n=1 Tax=Nocardia takedensis TaxID=259390 RepID=UPI003F771D92
MVDRHPSTGNPDVPVTATEADPAVLSAQRVEDSGASPSRLARTSGTRAFEKFFRHHVHAVRFWASLELGSRYQDVDDIVNEVMLAALQRAESRGGFDVPEAVPVPWLRTVTRNKAVDHLRKVGRGPIPMSDEDLRPLLVEYTHVEEELVAAQDLLVRVMRDLSLRQREVLSRWMTGYTVKEITTMLGYSSEKAVHQHLRRAKQLIRDRLANDVRDFSIDGGDVAE